MNRESFWLPKKEQDRRTEEELLEGDGFMEAREREVEGEESIVPSNLRNTYELADEDPTLPERLHEWYSKAMKRRDREPLEQSGFVSHFFEGSSFDETYAFGDNERGYLLGYTKNGVFIPTHFAPRTLRSGYELLKDLGESAEVPSVMSITPDLRETVEKLPSWHNLNMGGFVSNFRGQDVPKEIVYNDHPEVRDLMWGLLSEYLDDTEDRAA